MTDKFGATIFCDDIREELGGKLSYMGVYRGNLIIASSPPVQLAKLCISSTFYSLAGQEINQLNFRVMSTAQEDPLFLIEVDLQPMKEQIEAYRNRPPDPQDPRYATWTVNAALSPFLIEKPMTLRARFDVDGVEVKVGAIDISFEQADQPPTPYG